MREHLLPFFNERDVPVDMLVFHASAFSAENLLHQLDYYHCSCHYIVDLDGSVVKVVDEKHSAQHAGEGFWRGEERSLNNRSIGIEVCNMSLGQQPFADVQMAKLIPFANKLVRKYNIEACNIVGHSDVAPLRKADPGLAFPWKRLAREGLGIWYEPKNAVKIVEENVAQMLAAIGYDTRTPEAVNASAYAFCRHFLPQFVQVDDNPAHLVDHIFPASFDFMNESKFVQTLKAVTYSYLKTAC